MSQSGSFEGWPSILSQLLGRRDLSTSQAEDAISEILRGDATPSQMTAFIVALRAKGETAAELEGMLHGVRSAGHRVSLSPDVASRAIDIVGTGGDRSNSVNVSTMAAIVAAGAGVPVCKHGNRAASSKCGSADLLAEAGMEIELDSAGVEACIATAGFGFCLAARFHPAFRYTGPSRREIGVPTVFNLLGPMANPAPVENMLVGVAAAEMMGNMAEALATRGVRRAWVVHGHGGLDELSLSGPNMVHALRDGEVERMEIDAHDYGIARAEIEAVRGGDPADNLSIFRALLEGHEGAVRDIVVFNAACALVVAGAAVDVTDGLERARASIDSGAANDVLAAAAAESRRQAERMEL
ncbi:MAG: anthranilate phosphoribosyltransferase [Ilumatobacteraceae bacterium]